MNLWCVVKSTQQKRHHNNCALLRLSFSYMRTYSEKPSRLTVLTFPCSPSALCWCRKWQRHSSPSHTDPASDSERGETFIRRYLSHRQSDSLRKYQLTSLHLRVKNRHSDAVKCPPDSYKHWPEPEVLVLKWKSFHVNLNDLYPWTRETDKKADRGTNTAAGGEETW